MYTQESSCTGKVFILDAGALLAGLQLSLPCKSHTTSLVADEIRDYESRINLERAVEAGRLEITSVEIDESLKRSVRKGLSEPDISIIALALLVKNRGLEPIVFTDDYLLQEELLKRRIEVRPVRYKGSLSYMRGGKG